MQYHLRSNLLIFILAPLIAAILFSPNAQAWSKAGHFYIARGAVANLPKQMPEFFRDGVRQIAHSANTPDVIKNPDLKQITNTEAPNHYMDMELLRGHKLPPTRFEYIKMCKYKLHDNASYIGFLPYAITEWQQRLTVCFAEYRRWGDNKFVQNEALVAAGIMTHYAGDLVQPLHTTVNYNGKVDRQGRSPHTGIHQKVDFAPAYMTYNQIFSKWHKRPQAHADNVFAYVVRELKKSHAKVGKVYSLASQFPKPADFPQHLSKPVEKFIKLRLRVGANFVASLMLSAWVKSKDIKLPVGLNQDQYDYHFNPDKTPNKW